MAEKAHLPVWEPDLNKGRNNASHGDDVAIQVEELMRTRQREFHQGQGANSPSLTGRIDGCSLPFRNGHRSCKPEAFHRCSKDPLMRFFRLDQGVPVRPGNSSPSHPIISPLPENRLPEEKSLPALFQFPHHHSFNYSGTESHIPGEKR